VQRRHAIRPAFAEVIAARIEPREAGRERHGFRSIG
jgi:hypothetical protein